MRPSRSRRLAFAVATTFAFLGLAEALGRLLPDPRTRPQLTGTTGLDLPYDPDTQLVALESGGTPAGPSAGTWGFMRGGNTFHDDTWTLPKPAGRWRMVAVGDSTVFGLFPLALKVGLHVPDREVEVLNFGVRAIASDRVRIVADTAVKQDPDLMLVYAGHNELLEERLNPQSLEPFDVRRRRSAWVNSGIGRILQGILPQRAASDRAKVDPREFGPVTDAEWATVSASYRTNMRAICDGAHAAGVPVVFVEPISSLMHAPEVSPASDPDRAVQASVARALDELRRDPDADFDALASDVIDHGPNTPPAVWITAATEIVHGRPDRALPGLRRARLADEHPWRVTERQIEVLREVGRDCGAPVIPTEPAFLGDPRYLRIDDPLFVDQVHPSEAGVAVLAQAVADGLLPSLPAGSTFVPAPLPVAPPATASERGFKLPTDPAGAEAPR